MIVFVPEQQRDLPMLHIEMEVGKTRCSMEKKSQDR